MCNSATPALGQAQPTGADYVAFRLPPEAEHYNFKMGRLRARLSGSAMTEWTDNINLSQQQPQSELTFGPDVGLAFDWRPTSEQDLKFDLGLGYRWHVNNPSLDSLTIAPTSRIEHRIIVDHVQFLFHDDYSLQTDPTERPEISGAPGTLVNFKRFNNTTGLSTSWKPIKDLTLVASYDFTYNRSMSGQFTSLDHNGNALGSALYYSLTPRWMVGLNLGYSLNSYPQHIQNDSTAYSIGPVVSFKASEHFQANASVGYSRIDFAPTGTITDQSQSRGINYVFWVDHRFNSKMQHTLRISDVTSDGLGSNFTETTAIQYEFRVKVRARLSLNPSVVYEQSVVSGVGGEHANRYLLNFGAQWNVSRRWDVGLSGAHVLRTSDQLNHGYAQNRLTLTVTRNF